MWSWRGLVAVGWLVGGLAAVEAVGGRVRDDGGALLLLLGLSGVVGGFVAMVRRGWAPWAGRPARRIAGWMRGLRARVAPPLGVALRLPPGERPRPLRGRVVWTALLVLLAGGLLALGQGLLAALAFTRDHLPTTVHLLALAVVWAPLVTVTWLGLLASAWAFAARRPGDRPWLSLLRSLPLLLLWGLGIFALARLPGAVPVVAVLLAALAHVGGLVGGEPAACHLYARDRRGRLRALDLDAWHRRWFWLLAAGLLAVAALGQAPRLLSARPPSGPFALTLGLGLTASLAALFLVSAGGAWLRRLLRPPGGRPERGLRPTLWWPGGDLAAPWAKAARARGWAIPCSPRPPAGGYDLVVGRRRPGVPAFHPGGEDVEEVLFRLQRRLHVTKRRAFRRGFARLYKAVVRRPRLPGEGWLLCPHVSAVAAVVRDTDEHGPDGGRGGFFGGPYVGPAYEEVFEPRLRRYLGDLLGRLEIDVLYWQDGVRFADLRRVLVVCFEIHDQGRHPLLDAHVAALPGLEVLVLEPEDGASRERSGEGPPPFRARILLVRRRRGGEETPREVAPPRQRAPVGV